MKHNRISWIGNGAFVILCILGLFIIAVRNMIRGHVNHPMSSLIILLGLSLFSVAKASVIKREGLFSFGTKNMNQAMANLYRIGNFLMFVGFLFTFA